MSSLGKTSKTRAVPSPVKPGDVVADKYRVERTLAAGGMGVVALARHVGLDQPVALKFLIPLVQDEHTTARFLREARASAKIQSEHVVKVFDCGVLPSGVPYMAMEYLDGVDLARRLREGGAFPVQEATDVLLEAIVGVAAAHAAGIVHRDLKPSNLFLANQGGSTRVVKVLDFGISKVKPGPDDLVEDDLTGTAMMLGSPRYISPEQAQSSRSVDFRADIWSLGVILYELLDGKCPFTGDTMGEVLGKILLHRPAPLCQTRSEVPQGLSAVIERCLARDKELRFESVAALAAALVPFASPRGLIHAERAAAVLGTTLEAALAKPVATAPHADATTLAEPSDRTVGTWAQVGEGERSRSRGGLVFALGAAALAVLLVSGYLLVRGGASEPPEERSSLSISPAVSTPARAPAASPSAAPRTASPSVAPSVAASSPDATSSASSGPSVTAPPPRPPRPVGGGVLDRSD
jgi:serine/threonine-protein kinase